jgi:hypothetical protein
VFEEVVDKGGPTKAEPEIEAMVVLAPNNEEDRVENADDNKDVAEDVDESRAMLVCIDERKEELKVAVASGPLLEAKAAAEGLAADSRGEALEPLLIVSGTGSVCMLGKYVAVGGGRQAEIELQMSHGGLIGPHKARAS